MNMDNNEHLPSYFNAAEKWPGKIHEPLDQGNCAASWAFSTAGELQEVMYIYTLTQPFLYFIILLMYFYLLSCSFRPNLYSVHGTHDPSTLTPESDFL